MGISVELTKRIIQKTFESIIGTLETEGRFELRNFGVFEVKQRKARTGRNPRIGAVVQVPATTRVSLKAGKEMAARIGRHTNWDWLRRAKATSARLQFPSGCPMFCAEFDVPQEGRPSRDLLCRYFSSAIFTSSVFTVSDSRQTVNTRFAPAALYRL